MSWQPPPATGPMPVAPPLAPYPAAAAGYMPPQPAGRPPIVRWVAGLLVFAVLVAGGVMLHRTVLARFFGGAASPEEAVRAAIEAIENNDWRQLALMLPPDEVAGYADVQQQSERIMRAIGDEADLNNLYGNQGVHVNVENLELSAHDQQTELAKVSIENADIAVSFDTSKMPDWMRKDFERDRMSFDKATVKIRGATVGSTVTTNGKTETQRDTTVRVGGRTQPPFVMAVERDGSWYVSPTFTGLQYASEEAGYETSPPSVAPGFDSPAAAADGLLNAIAKTFQTHDISAIADAVGGVEGRALQTYRKFINSRLLKSDRSQVESIDTSGSKFSLLSVNGDTARVRLDRVRLAATTDGQTGEFDWDGSCLRVTGQADNGQYCLSDTKAKIFKPLVDRLNYVVAVRADGGWKISALRTVFSWFSDVLSWVGDKELAIIKALVHHDMTEFTKSTQVAGTVNLDGSTSVSIERMGPYIDGGYALVDVPNPKGKEFTVSCHSSGGNCDVLTTFSPSGEPQSPYAGGKPGTYKALVFGPTGEVEVAVETY
ncbi:MAG: hypothetical protein QOH60_3858 [Mycobacterium sp.]|nr:hypothetical protein [Mycobacterium sp.]